jgi:hypothetical protein
MGDGSVSDGLCAWRYNTKMLFQGTNNSSLIGFAQIGFQIGFQVGLTRLARIALAGLFFDSVDHKGNDSRGWLRFQK